MIYNMDSVFCKDLNNLKYKKLNNNHYSFLEENHKYDINIIYDLLNSQEDYKIRNLYRYLYLRLIKLNRIYSELGILNIYKEEIDSVTLNELMDSYINGDKIKEIIIINSILFYYYPY